MSEDVEVLTPAEEVQAQLNKLKLSLDAAIPYRLPTVFAKISGWGAKGEIKRRAKLIQQVEPTLKKMLMPKEEVLYVAKGTQSSTSEALFMGAYWAAMMNQTVFVLTNLRILMLRSKGNGKPTHTFWVLYYSEIDLFQPSWTGALKLKLKDGKKFTFTGFPKLDRKAMPTIFQDALDDYRKLNFHPAVSQSRENLCSHCFQVVPKDRYVCRNCGSDFWTPKELGAQLGLPVVGRHLHEALSIRDGRIVRLPHQLVRGDQHLGESESRRRSFCFATHLPHRASGRCDPDLLGCQEGLKPAPRTG